MNKKDLFFTYILAFICIACSLTLHYPTPLHFPFLLFLLLVGFPLLLIKKPILNRKMIDNMEINNKLVKFMYDYDLTPFYIMITVFALLVTVFNYHEGKQYINETCDNCEITTVKTVSKANEIQTFLAKQNCMTEQEAIFNDKGEVIGYKIKLTNLIRKKDYYNAISELLDTSIIDSSVEMPISSTFYKIKINKSNGDKNKFRFIFKAYSPK